MAITELLPVLSELSYSDKLLLLRFLVEELSKEAGLAPFSSPENRASDGLHDSFEAAAVLAKALAEEKVTTHG